MIFWGVFQILLSAVLRKLPYQVSWRLFIAEREHGAQTANVGNY